MGRGALLPLAASHFYFFGASSRKGGRPQERGSGAGRRRTAPVGAYSSTLGGRQIKSGAEHRRTEGKHRRNYFFSGVSGYYFCVGVVLVDGGRTHRPFGAIPLPFTIIF